MTLTRYETIGISTSIVLLVVALSIARFFPFSHDAEVPVATHPSDIIVVDPNAENTEAALAQAIIDGSTADGRVTKLIVHDVSLGSGRQAKVGDMVTVHYIGLLKDGPEFDNSYTKDTPVSFKVGAGEVIKGWEQGIVGMKEGGERILIVPATLGYGDTAVNSLPAHATLLFSIQLLSIE